MLGGPSQPCGSARRPYATVRSAVPYGTEWRAAVVVDIHERGLPVPVDEVGPLLDRLGGWRCAGCTTRSWRIFWTGRRRWSGPGRPGRRASRPGCGCCAQRSTVPVPGRPRCRPRRCWRTRCRGWTGPMRTRSPAGQACRRTPRCGRTRCSGTRPGGCSGCSGCARRWSGWSGSRGAGPRRSTRSRAGPRRGRWRRERWRGLLRPGQPVHPVIVRAMLTRAARRLADRSAPRRRGAQWSR